MRALVLVPLLVLSSALTVDAAPAPEAAAKPIVLDGAELSVPQAPVTANAEAWSAWVASMRTLHRQVSDELDVAMIVRMRRNASRNLTNDFDPNYKVRINEAILSIHASQANLDVLGRAWREQVDKAKDLGIPEETFAGGIR